MWILTAIVSILLVAALAFAVRRIFGLKICPICAGVSVTWLWMLVVLALGLPVETPVVAMLMGGSVVGIAYQLEKRLPSGRSSVLWKTSFMPLGFAAAYWLVNFDWRPLAAALGAIAVLVVLFFAPWSKRHVDSRSVRALEDKMKDCC